eukprot:2596677-Pleurochrysis_carterae.AAC.1
MHMKFDVDSDGSSGCAELFNMPSAFHTPMTGDELAMLAGCNSDADDAGLPSSSESCAQSAANVPVFSCQPQPATKSQRGKYIRIA